MTKLLIVTAALAALGATALAQDASRLYSNPSLPPQEALDRLRLKVAWTASIPVEGRRDGIYSVQIVPRVGGGGLELLVQSRSGQLTAIDAATGRSRWTTHVGTAYRVSQPVAYNRQSVFVVNNIELIAVSREDGRKQWGYQLENGAAAPPVADDEQIYVSLTSGRFTTFALPKLQFEEVAKRGGGKGDQRLEAARVLKGIDLPSITSQRGIREATVTAPAGPQPRELYAYALDDRVELPPLAARDRILLPGAGGRIMGVAKGSPREAWPAVATKGKVLVPAGQYGDDAYVAGTDFNVYAVSITGGKLHWRFPAGGTLTDRPAAVEKDVYVAVGRAGLLRLDRDSGEEQWRNADAAHFLAANPKFVYAFDRNNRLVVIDRDRGTTLSTYAGTRDFAYLVQNDWDDRLYLAANNGLIVCLHDRAYAKPLPMKKVEEERPKLPPPKDGGKPGAGVKP